VSIMQIKCKIWLSWLFLEHRGKVINFNLYPHNYRRYRKLFLYCNFFHYIFSFRSSQNFLKSFHDVSNFLCSYRSVTWVWEWVVVFNEHIHYETNIVLLMYFIIAWCNQLYLVNLERNYLIGVSIQDSSFIIFLYSEGVSWTAKFVIFIALNKFSFSQQYTTHTCTCILRHNSIADMYIV